MFVERVILTNFRCFGPEAVSIELTSQLTAFVGANGTGKTAVLFALLRLFGVTADQRRLRRRDFHVPISEPDPAQSRTLSIEAILSFPELDDPEGDHASVPEFFSQMVADDANHLKCRLRLDATWTDDGTLDGAIDQTFRALPSFGACDADEGTELKAIDRGRIQMVYVPASRDGVSQVATFFRGRIWRAVAWSANLKETFQQSSLALNTAFGSESSVQFVAAALQRRWHDVYTGDTDATPRFRPIDLRFQEFIRDVDVAFHPDECGTEKSLDELSDGQRSLFHLAMVAATLDVEATVATETDGFQHDGLSPPALTMVAIEEPENNLAPFYLSRIIKLVSDLSERSKVQAVVSSHAPSILTRIEPAQVRHFRLAAGARTAEVRSIAIPTDNDNAARFVREGVRTYPELYFARFVVLGEGASEEVVLPRLAEALGFSADRSFVAVVPLGGRHVNHLWRLLDDLQIPYATLLDLDLGREGGGWGRIKTTCAQLIDRGHADRVFPGKDETSIQAALASFDRQPNHHSKELQQWVTFLRGFNVFFCAPLDLDYSMLEAYESAYTVLEPTRSGPSNRGEPRTSVLGEGGVDTAYPAQHDKRLRWYRYLFLGRGKPSTHVRVLSSLDNETLAKTMPGELRALIEHVQKTISRSVANI